MEHPEEITQAKEDFYERELQKFESPTSMPMLVQNDVTTKYGFGMLNGEIVHGFQEGYLSAQEKFADTDLENSKIANFKKQILFKKPLQSPLETVNNGIQSLGECFSSLMREGFKKDEAEGKLTKNP